MSGRARASVTVRASDTAAGTALRSSARPGRKRQPEQRDGKRDRATVLQRPAASGNAGHDLDNLTIFPVAPTRDGDSERVATGGDAGLLMDRATAGPAGDLPHRELLEARFGRSLAGVDVHDGPQANAALHAMDAAAATRDEQIAFRDPEPDVATTAHEVVHVLQADRSEARHETNADETGVVEADAPAEVEAARLAAAVATANGDAPTGEIDITEKLPSGAVALQRAKLDAPSTGSTSVADPATSFSSAVSREPASVPATVEPVAAAAVATGEQEPTAAAGAPAAGGVAPELPPAPEPGITAEDVAAREAAIAEAEAILQAAQSSSGLIDAFATAPPTVKARQQGQLGTNLDGLAKREAQEIQDGLPELHAELKTEAAPVEAVQVAAPEAVSVELEPEAPGPAPEPEIPETLDPGNFSANADITRGLAYGLPEEPEGRAEQIGESLSAVQTTDPEIERSPGPPPAVPLGGETDPERVVAQAGEGVDRARASTDEAQAAVINGPGPEQVQPVALDQAYSVDALVQPQIAAPASAEGAQAYLDMNLPPEVQTAFDLGQQVAMEESMTGAREQAARATAERDQARDTEVQTAQDEAERLSTEADGSQRAKVGEARQKIQDERQSTLDQQGQAVAGLEGNVETRRTDDLKAIDTRVKTDEAQINERYAGAERDARAKIEAGEREAEQKRQKAERDAEELSWWERAVNFVKDAFNALVSLINDIFDAVRSLVNGILDAAKSFAMGLIDAVAGFIKGAIAAFGEFLKFAVDNLIGGLFPELAAKLNAAIDDAVTASQEFVDSVANDLKAGVAALVDTLKAGLNKLLDVFQAGLNLAVGLIEAAITGDWGALARKALEAVLMVAGISPETFYEFVGRQQETFQLIVDDPGGFLGNIVDAFLGGVRLFGKNFLTHLQTGIIGWLTGKLGSAGITLPAQFDLAGVLDLARQILGLTWEKLKAKAVKLVGAENVERVTTIVSYIDTLVTGGWAALWERLSADLASLRDQVFDAIKSYLLESILFAAITKVASLFNPVGAIVQLVLAAWNLYTFLRDQFQRIWSVVRGVLDSIGDVARGVLEPAIMKVETTLAGLLPLALDLLARLLGLGNVGARVREQIVAVQTTIDTAIDRVIQGALGALRGGPATAVAAAPVTAAPGAAVAPGPDVPVAAKNHATVAGQVAGQLQQTVTTGTYDTVRERVVQRATELETHWKGRFEPGIVLKVAFSPVEADKADSDIDFEVVIAPNTERKKGSVAAGERTAAKLEGGQLVVNNTVTFKVGDAIQVKKGSSWAKEPRIITRLSTATIGGENRIMVSFDTDPPTLAATVTAETYPAQWQRKIESLEGLSAESLDRENKKPTSEAWSSIKVARWVLNHRAHGHQTNNPPQKQWEHIIESETGGKDSADNLALADGTVNHRLGIYYGEYRRYTDLAIREDITDPIILRDYLRGKPPSVQLAWKKKIYASPDFRVALRWAKPAPRGPYQILD